MSRILGILALGVAVLSVSPAARAGRVQPVWSR